MQQERTKARAAFDKAIDLAPDSPDAHLWKALLILDRKPLDRKQFYEAHASFNAYFRHLNGKRPKVEALLGRAIARFRLVTRDEAPQKSGDDGDPEEHRNDILSGAIEDFDSALQLLRIEEKKTSAALESEMLIAAKDKLDMRLKELQKHRVMAFAYRGLLYSLFGSPRIARYDFARAISLGENGGIKSAVAHVGRGLFDAHKREKKWRDSAQQDANDAVEDTEDMSPDDRRGILLNAARIYAIIVKNLHYGPGSGLTYQTYRRAYPQYQSDGVALLKQALDLTRQEKQAWLWNDIIAKDPYFRSLRKHIDYLRLQKTYGTQEVKKR